MDFRLSDEQELLVETARAMFAKECPASVVRAAAADPTAATELFDRHLRDWVALAGGPSVDLALFLIEAGAAVAPGPFLATAGFFASLLTAADHPLAESAVEGSVTGTVAIAGRLATDGQWSVDDGPERIHVVDTHLVDDVALVLPGPSVAVVPVADLDVALIETLDLARSYATVTVPHGIEGEPIDPAALDDAVERAVLAVAAELVGVARWLIDASVAYARERVQFGRPIGSFQAVQHRLVDMALAHQEAGAAVSYAAMCIDAGHPDRHRATHVAKAVAGTAARKAARGGLQVHGGVGFTWEHDLHLRLRRAFADDALCGTHEWHLDRLADLAFAEPT